MRAALIIILCLSSVSIALVVGSVIAVVLGAVL